MNTHKPTLHEPDTNAAFDWDDLERRLCECEEDVTEEDRALLCAATRTILAWIVAGTSTGRTDAKRIGLRAVALAWVVNPGLFSGYPSLSDLAKRLGCHKVALSEHASEFSAQFKIRNRSQIAHNPNI